MLESFRFGDVVTIAMGDTNRALVDPSVKSIVLTGALSATRTLSLPQRAGADYFIVNDCTGNNINAGPGITLSPGARSMVVFDGTNWRDITGTGGTGDIDINALPAKATPVNADELVIADSEDSFALKKVTVEDIKATLTTLDGDVTGGIESTIVEKLNGYTLSIGTPTIGQAIVFNDSSQFGLEDVPTQTEFDSEIGDINGSLEAIGYGTNGCTTQFPFTPGSDNNAVWDLGSVTFEAGPLQDATARTVALTASQPYGLWENSAGSYGATALYSAAEVLTYSGTPETTLNIGTINAILQYPAATTYLQLIDVFDCSIWNKDNKLRVFSKTIGNIIFNYIAGVPGYYDIKYTIGSSHRDYSGSYVLVYSAGVWRYLGVTDLTKVSLTNPLKSSWTGTLSTVAVGEYYMVHIFAHSYGTIAVYGSYSSTNLDSVRSQATTDMRKAVLKARIDAEHNGNLSSNLFPLGTAIYQRNATSTVLVINETLRPHLIPYDPQAQASNEIQLVNSIPLTTNVTSTNGSIPNGAGVGAGYIDVIIKGTTYTVPAVMRTFSVTGNTANIGAYCLFAPYRADAMEVAGSTIAFVIPRYQIACGNLQINVTSITGGSSALYKAWYSLDADSLGNLSATSILTVGSSVLTGPVLTTTATHHIITFTTTGSPTSRIITGNIEFGAWKP